MFRIPSLDGGGIKGGLAALEQDTGKATAEPSPY